MGRHKRKLSDPSPAVAPGRSVPLKYVLVIASAIFLINVAFIFNGIDRKRFSRWKGKDPKYANCNVTIEESIRALSRVKDAQCRSLIHDKACKMQSGDYGPKSLPRTCPYDDVSKTGQWMGCYRDTIEDRLLNGTMFKFPEQNSPDYCIQSCLRIGYELAGVQYRYECFCGNLRDLESSGKSLDIQNCQMYECPGAAQKRCGGFKAMAVYNTGHGEPPMRRATYTSANRPIIDLNNKLSIEQIKNIYHQSCSVRIVFLLQLNGRDVRQVKRLLKLIYTPHHYYLVHVDARQEFMFREMLLLEKQLKVIGNFHVKRNRFHTIWGGASLLEMILDAIGDLTVGPLSVWKWDFLYNLSETDFPIATLPELEAVLASHKGYSFLRGHGHNAAKFITKQGLDRIFIQCQDRMWRLGNRLYFPSGLRVDGGSDWFALDREFAYYAANSNDTTPKETRKLWQNVLLPAESFFHSLAHSSEFCARVINSNLKFTNWQRKKGCKCQYKHVVDWCGCSPSVFVITDSPRLHHEKITPKLWYFARKFEPIIDQSIIAFAETQVLGGVPSPFSSHPSFGRVWLNIFDASDTVCPSPCLSPLLSALSALVLTNQLSTSGCSQPLVQSAHVYRSHDQSERLLLVRAQYICAERKVETEFLVRRLGEKRDGKLDGIPFSLDAIDVGTNFDQKEEIFRNYAGIMNEESRPTLRHVWSKLDPFNDQLRVTVAWQDPKGIIQSALSDTMSIESGSVEHWEFEHERLDKAGVWKVIIYGYPDDNELYQFAFPVFPSDPTKDQAAVDSLVERFYKIVHVCSASELLDLTPCKHTEWSSMGPDPKSDIKIGYDSNTGWLV